MTAELHGVVVAHGDLARALVASVEEISGLRGVLTAVSNSGCDRASLEQRIAEAVAGRPSLVFGFPEVRVVTGVNLAMLLDFVFHRELDVVAAAGRAADAGAKAILQR